MNKIFKYGVLALGFGYILFGAGDVNTYEVSAKNIQKKDGVQIVLSENSLEKSLRMGSSFGFASQDGTSVKVKGIYKLKNNYNFKKK